MHIEKHTLDIKGMPGEQEKNVVMAGSRLR